MSDEGLIANMTLFGGVNTEAFLIYVEQILLPALWGRYCLKNAINSSPYSIVHIATHGQFSSQAEQTFIVTWDSKLNVRQLNDLLSLRESNRLGAIELLVLSACETLAGDERASLGLAGVAVRAGARSTLATLWQVNDEATAKLMSQFYAALQDSTTTKAEALRQAQLVLLNKSSIYACFRIFALP